MNHRSTARRTVLALVAALALALAVPVVAATPAHALPCHDDCPVRPDPPPHTGPAGPNPVLATQTLPLSGPRKHIRMQLGEVQARNVEDVLWDGDEFYLDGWVSQRRPGSATAAVNPFGSRVVQIGAGHVVPFHGWGRGDLLNPPIHSTDSNVVFEGDVAPGDVLHVKLAAMDQDAGSDVATWALPCFGIAVAAVVPLTALTGPVGGFIDAAAGAACLITWAVAAAVDPDDVLGVREFDVNPDFLPTGTTTFSPTYRGGTTSWSDWDYTTTVRVTVT